MSKTIKKIKKTHNLKRDIVWMCETLQNQHHSDEIGFITCQRILNAMKGL